MDKKYGYYQKEGTLEKMIEADKKSKNPKYSSEMDKIIIAIVEWKKIHKVKGLNTALLVNFMAWRDDDWGKTEGGYELKITDGVIFGHGPYEIRKKLLEQLTEAQNKSKK